MGTNNQPPEDTSAASRGEVTFLTAMGSVFAAFFGVQSNANRKRDFESGKVWHFIIAGLLFVFFFLFCIYLLVNYIIASA